MTTSQAVKKTIQQIEAQIRQAARKTVAKRVKKPLSGEDRRKRARTFFYLKLWDNIYEKWG